MVPRLLTRSYRQSAGMAREQGLRCTYSFGHADTSVSDGQGLVFFVGDDVDAQILAGVQLAWI